MVRGCSVEGVKGSTTGAVETHRSQATFARRRSPEAAPAYSTVMVPVMLEWISQW